MRPSSPPARHDGPTAQVMPDQLGDVSRGGECSELALPIAPFAAGVPFQSGTSGRSRGLYCCPLIPAEALGTHRTSPS
jgi:hypothetical protein